MAYEHNWFGLLCIAGFAVVMGTIGLIAARREARAKRELEEQKAKIAELEEKMLEGFRKIVTRAIELGLALEIAIEFGVSISTITRWSKGVTTPLPRLRIVILDYISNLLREKMRLRKTETK